MKFLVVLFALVAVVVCKPHQTFQIQVQPQQTQVQQQPQPQVHQQTYQIIHETVPARQPQPQAQPPQVFQVQVAPHRQAPQQVVQQKPQEPIVIVIPHQGNGQRF